MLAMLGLQAQSIRERLSEIEKIEDEHLAIKALQSLAVDAKQQAHSDTLSMINLKIAAYYFDYSLSFDSAVHYCDMALVSVRENQNEDNLPYLEAWYYKGYYNRKWDKFDESRRALQVVLDADKNPFTCKATYQMGKLYKDRNEYSLAIKYYNEALELAHDDVDLQIEIYEFISLVYLIMGTEEGAESGIEYYDKMLATINSLPDGRQDAYIPLVYYNKGQCYYQLDQLDEAIKYVKKAEDLLKSDFDDEDFLGLITDFYGYVAYENGDYELAIEKYREGIKQFQFSYDLGRDQGLAGSYFAMAEAFRELDKLDSALYYIDQTLIDRTFGYDNNNKSSSLPSFDMMLENGEKSYLIDDLKMKASICEKIGQTHSAGIDSAIHYYELAEQLLDVISYDLIDEESKIFWRKNAKDLYFDLIRLNLQLGKTQEAFYFSEKSKYVILEEHLRKLDFSGLSSTNNLVLSYQQLLDTIKEVKIAQENNRLNLTSDLDTQKRLVDLRSREDDLLSRMRSEYPSLHRKLFSWNKPDLAKIQARLAQSNALLISFFVHDSISYAFYISDSAIQTRTLSSRSFFSEKITALLETFESDNIKQTTAEAYETKSHALYTALIDDKLLASRDQIILIPDDILSLIPFEVLVNKKQENERNFNTLGYLIKDKSVRYLINSNALFADKERDIQTSKVVSFTPSFSGKTALGLATRSQTDGELMPLTGAIKEMEKLCALFPCESFREEVNEELFYKQATNPSAILHIATHAIMNDSIPEYSKLVMQQSASLQDHDNYIHLFELKNKVIPSELTILSACKTGSGKIYHGEGLASLGVAFHYAGSPNLVTSLWSIPDQSSSVIMSDFYQNLKNGLPKFEALRQAKLDYLTENMTNVTHPFYWGGLLYYGDDLVLPTLEATSMAFPTSYFLLLLVVLLLLGLFIYTKYRSKPVG